MPTQEDEKKPKPEQPQGPETPEQAAARAADVAQVGREKAAAGALAGAESEAPTAESAEQDPVARAREIAQKYLDTIPEADRKLTDPKQVERLLYVLENANDPDSHLFSNVDKLGNLPSRGQESTNKGDAKGVAETWRAFAKDPVGISGETDKVQQIANSTLPETVRAALLSIILKEGDYPATAMAQEAVEKLEQTGDTKALSEVREKYSEAKNSKMMEDKSLRQKAARELLKGLYPDLMQSKEVTLLTAMSSMPYENQNDQNTIAAMVEQYVQLFGDAPLSERVSAELEGATNAKEVITKIQDGSIPEFALGDVIPMLQSEIRSKIAQKATSAEEK